MTCKSCCSLFHNVTIVGPLLFCIYVNDLVNWQTDLYLYSYADDARLISTIEYFTIVNLTELNQSKITAVQYVPEEEIKLINRTIE